VWPASGNHQGSLALGMGIDEFRRNHMAGGVDRLFTADLVLCEGSDVSILDTYVGDRTVLRLRVNAPFVEDDEVVVGSHGESGARQADC